jgi:hypothetical protein
VSWTRVSLLREIEVGGRSAAELLDARTFDDLQLASLVADGDKLFVNGQRNPGYYAFPAGGVAASGGAASTATSTPRDISDRLMVFDVGSKTLAPIYDQSTGMYNVELMGVHQGKLFVNLPGDGLVIVDVSDPSKPAALHFARTLGYATHIEFAGDDAYVGSGFFGITHIDLRSASSLAVD